MIMPDIKNPNFGASLVPCSTIDDLYSTSARQTVTRLIADWLHRQRLTASEFMHSAAALNKFESAGTSYQHAVQKMAVAVSSKSNAPVVEIIKALNGLATEALRRVYTDERRGLFPAMNAEQIVRKAEDVAEDPMGRYVLNGILVKYLAGAKTWNEKLLLVLGLRRIGTAQDSARALLFAVTDSIAAEVVADMRTLNELIGPEKEFGETLLDLVNVFLGLPEGGDGFAESLKALAEDFSRDELPETRGMIANYILSECKGTRRLCPTSLDGEMTAFRKLVDALKAAPERYINSEELAAAYAVRSKRFVTQEALFQFTAPGKTLDEKLDRLLAVEENVEGTANKRGLTPFAMSFLSGSTFEEELAADAPVPHRLKRVADLQARIMRSGFLDAQKDQMAGTLDAMAVRIESQSRFMAGLEARVTDPARCVDMYLQLFTAGLFTEGNLARKARRAILVALANPDFLSRYTEDKGKDRQTVLMDLVEQLKRIGISREESVRAMTPG